MKNPFRLVRPRSCIGCRALNGSPQTLRGYYCALRHRIDQDALRPESGECQKPRTVGALVSNLTPMPNTEVSRCGGNDAAKP